MLCPKCKEGKFEAKNSSFRKRTGKFTRYRVCKACGYKAKTIEIEIETYEAENELMNDIIDAVTRYSEKAEKTAKIV